MVSHGRTVQHIDGSPAETALVTCVSSGDSRRRAGTAPAARARTAR